METHCAWCPAPLDTDEGALPEAPISHGICPDCRTKLVIDEACAVLSERIAALEAQEALLLEMVGDLYEVAQGLGPKAGVTLLPAPAVRAWLARRETR